MLSYDNVSIMFRYVPRERQTVMHRRLFTEEQELAIANDRDSGMSFSKVGRKYKIVPASAQAIYKRVKRKSKGFCLMQ